MTPDKMKLIAKRLFIGGFFFLPFLWLVNAFFFRTTLRCCCVFVDSLFFSVVFSQRSILQTPGDARSRESVCANVGGGVCRDAGGVVGVAGALSDAARQLDDVWRFHYCVYSNSIATDDDEEKSTRLECKVSNKMKMRNVTKTFHRFNGSLSYSTLQNFNCCVHFSNEQSFGWCEARH